MKKLFFTYLAIALGMVLEIPYSSAQQYQYLQTSDQYGALPYNAGAAYKAQFIYYPSDFTGMGSGTITKLYLKVNSTVSPNITNLGIKMGSTALNVFPGSSSTPFITTLTTCYSGAYTGTSDGNNWVVITLQVPYVYNNSQNLIVELSQNGFTTGFNIGYVNNTTPSRRGIANTYSAVNGYGIALNPIAEIGFDIEPTPLGIHLASFEASQTDNYCLLNWKTYTEENNKGFYLERSNDGRTFENIGFVPAKNKAQEINSYFFTDLYPKEGTNYYRLKQVDIDESYTYSWVIKTLLNKRNNIIVYPNPAQNNIYLEMSPVVNGSWRLSNAIGKLLKEGTLEEKNIDISSLPKGIYILTIAEGGNLNSSYITKQ